MFLAVGIETSSKPFCGVYVFDSFPITTGNRSRWVNTTHSSSTVWSPPQTVLPILSPSNYTVDKEEIERLRRRFLKLDRDGSGTSLPFYTSEKGSAVDGQDNWIETSFCRFLRLRIIRWRCG